MAVGGTKGQANPLHPVGNKGVRGGRGRHGYSALGTAEEGDDEGEGEGEGAHERTALGVADMDVDVDVDIEADVDKSRHRRHQRSDSKDSLRAASGSNLADSNIKSRGKSYALSVGKLLVPPPGQVERGRSDTTTSTNSATGLLAASSAYNHGCGAGAGAYGEYGEYELGETASGEHSPARRHSAAVLPMDPAEGSLVRRPSLDSLAVPPLPPLPLGPQHHLHHYNARHSGTALSSIVEVLPAALPVDQQQQESDGSWEVVGEPAPETDTRTGTRNSVLEGKREGEREGGDEVGVALEEEGDVVDATLFLLKALRRLHASQRDEGCATIASQTQSQSQAKSQDAAPIGRKKCMNVHLRQTVEQLMQDYEKHFPEERRYLIEKKVSFVVPKVALLALKVFFFNSDLFPFVCFPPLSLLNCQKLLVQLESVA
jgi:hypothetical protein